MDINVWPRVPMQNGYWNVLTWFAGSQAVAAVVRKFVCVIHGFESLFALNSRARIVHIL